MGTIQRFYTVSESLKTRTLPSVAGFLLPNRVSGRIITTQHDTVIFDGIDQESRTRYRQSAESGNRIRLTPSFHGCRYRHFLTVSRNYGKVRYRQIHS